MDSFNAINHFDKFTSLEHNKSYRKFGFNNLSWFNYCYSFCNSDITVDALRIEQIKEDEGKSMAAGAAMAVVGWWTGYKLGGVVSLFTAEFFEKLGITDYWQATFLVLVL